ncbi:Sua5 YciO YrdC YwlC family protein [Arcobacteraceae bacterium]|nr:Sua5 YciO YrdC YwlC family protein [Arcobacteraceae bacterium]
MNSSLIYLTQTDTTVGFLSSNDKKLSGAKQRDTKQKILQVVSDYKSLKKLVRVPNKHKKFIRRAKTATIIYPNKLAFRVVKNDSSHQNFLQKFNVMYSTSANKTKNKFSEKYAINNSDIIVYSKENFVEKQASSIYKVNKQKIKKIR